MTILIYEFVLESGGVNQFDFNVSFNFNDRFYLGFTIGAYDVDYNKYTLYDEDFVQEMKNRQVPDTSWKVSIK